MAERDSFPTLADRARVLSANIAFFYLIFIFAANRWLPTGGLESVWLLSAFALWFLNLLSAPWFVPPRDALANSIGAICILVTAEIVTAQKFQAELEIIRWASVAYCAAVVALSLLALFLHDRNEHPVLARVVFRLTATFGTGEVLYTPPALVSIIGAYQGSPITTAWLLVMWTIFVIADPFRQMLAARRYWQGSSVAANSASMVGTIERIDHPNIVRVRLKKGASWKRGTLHTASMSDGDQRFVISLFTQMQGVDVVGTGLCVADVAERVEASPGQVFATHDTDKTNSFIEILSGARGSELIGFTVENSTIGQMRFEIAASAELSEGDVVFAKIGGNDVFYQILDAETAEESFDQNPRGTHIVRAAQLGDYDSAKGFTKHPWLPAMNTPLFWAKSRTFPPPTLAEDDFIIGRVPSTNIGVVAKIDDIVKFHTAILGVTGTGKTELALDVIREAVRRDVKVFCVDFTGEYRARLADLAPTFPSPTPQQIVGLEAKLLAVETGTYGAPTEKAALDAFLKTLRTHIDTQIATFLTSTTDSLGILELTEISNTKATLRTTEQYLSAIMAWARQNRQARRILLVLEEAHTIIPETFGSGFDKDTQWVVSRIGQIALQGRKYGVGLMVITQRTALVSKTILSQCNTFLTHSLIDQTSLNFLESVYSSQHVKSIPNLGQFEFLAFGKGLRVERPILLRREFSQAKKDASDRLRRPLPAVAPAAGTTK
ncbi:MAG: DUF87 domain-containing protein [Alphaproteobacteria bacterium]|nr:DUF87 domain-containing protein [Alphaproteobacteria bacterium]